MMQRPRENGDELAAYLDAIGREPLLTKEEEVELAQAIEHARAAEEALGGPRKASPARRRTLEAAVRKGEQARQRFISANLRLVVSIAKHYQGQGLPLMDLIQEGSFGLMRAVEKFDWKRGYKFSTYATWWIRQSIQRGLANLGRTIRLPVHVEADFRRVRRRFVELSQKLGHDPSVAELAKAVRLPKDRVQELLDVAPLTTTVSLSSPVGEDTEILELLADVEGESPFEAVEETLIREDIADAIQTALEEREAEVIALRFGLNEGRPHSLQEIGDRLGLSRERVRQIEREALGKLRRETRLSA